MGGSTTKTTQQQQGTSTVTLPQWMTDAGQSTFNKAQATAEANPIQAYNGPIAAPAAANQQQASGQAAATANTGAQDLNTARSMTAAATGGATPQVTAGNFDQAAAQQYMSPYTGEVQQRTLDEMRRQNTMQMGQQDDGFAASKAYGGTRQAVQDGELARGQNANMMDYLARSNADAYTNAQSQFGADRAASMQAQTQNGQFTQADRDRQLAAAGAANQTAQTADGVNSDNIMNLLKTGGVDQQTTGDQNQAAYQEFLRMQDAPMDRYRDLMSMLAGTPRNTTTNATSSGSSSQKSSPGLLNTLLAGGQMAASIYSDRRLKRDVTFLGRMANGLGVYLYRYVWDPLTGPRRTGVMADEVARIAPHALGPRICGFATVNYSKLGGF
jgi:hypothetical protein